MYFDINAASLKYVLKFYLEIKVHVNLTFIRVTFEANMHK